MIKKIIFSITRIFIPFTLLFLIAGCEIDGSEERYTYYVIYEVTGNSSQCRITVNDADGSEYTEDNIDLLTLSSQTWTYTFLKTYDYENMFIPLLTVEADLNNTENVTLSISWMDYKTDFTREELAAKTYTNNSGGFLGYTVEVTCPPLPL